MITGIEGDASESLQQKTQQVLSILLVLLQQNVSDDFFSDKIQACKSFHKKEYFNARLFFGSLLNLSMYAIEIIMAQK